MLRGDVGAFQYLFLASLVVHQLAKSFAVETVVFLVLQKTIIGFILEYLIIISVNLPTKSIEILGQWCSI